MKIEVVGVDLPLAEVSRIVRRMAEELGCDARWDGRKFFVSDPKEAPRKLDQDGFGAVPAISVIR
jgi:hypothetical protein